MKTLLQKDLYTPQEIADYFSVKARAVYLWIKQGKLSIIKVNNKVIRIKKDSLLRFINHKTSQ